MCREIHTIMMFHSYSELTSFIFLVIYITVLNQVWKYWKSATIMLLAIGVEVDGEDEQVKKEKKICLDETMVKKPSTYKCIPKYIPGTMLER